MKKIIFPLVLLLSTTAYALETDQFIAADIRLSDSVEIMNDYFQKSISKALSEVNKKDLGCQEVALRVMETATGKYSISKASTYASSSPLVERYPYDNVSEHGYIHQSFYQHAWLPLQVAYLARTININGIYLGTDKFGHFTRMGMSYYKNYLKLIKAGVTENEAIEKSIIKGFGSEYGILGYGLGGVLSFGDLEANFKGFMFALDMCKGKNPIIVSEKGAWIENPNHLFNLKDYFSPQMDESYNFSFWRSPLYKRVEEKLKTEYCDAQNSKFFQERMTYYKQIVKSNLNDLLIKKIIATQAKYDRKREDVAKSCEN